MPVTIFPSDQAASPWDVRQGRRYKQVSSPESLLQSTAEGDDLKLAFHAKRLLQSSFSDLSTSSSSSDTSLFAAKNGFVHTCLVAYNEHHRLVLRPDDVWIAILVQLSVYVNTHAETLRDTFVDHQGQKELHIEIVPPVPMEQFDHGALAYQMTKLMAGAIKDASWREWILPAFSTTEKTDQAVASVVFMGTMQKYFTFSWGTRCGLPEVTLQGCAADWAEMRRRCAERLPTLGKECARWAALLDPVLDGFVRSFAEPESPATKRFWQGIVCEHKPNGSGKTFYSGWITAFCFWGSDGACLHGPEAKGGGVSTVRLSTPDVPVGFVRVPVKVINFGVEIPSEMLAGSLGIEALKSRGDVTAKEKGEEDGGKAGETSRGAADAIQPRLGWFMYTV